MKKIYLLFIVLGFLLPNSKLFAQCSANLTSGSGTDNQTICISQPIVNITYLATGADTAIFSLPNGINGNWNKTNKFATISGTPTNTGVLKYKITFRCITNFADSGTIKVNPLPVASVSANQGQICSGQNAEFAITGTSGSVVTYRLNGSADKAVYLSAGKATVIIVKADTAQTLTLISVANPDGGCSQALTGSSTIKLFPLPTASISGATSVCQYSTQPALILKASNGTIPYTFNYYVNGGSNQSISTNGTSTAITANAPTNELGSFSYNLISLTDSKGCTQTQFLADSSKAIVNVLIKPFLTSSKITSVCNKAPFTYKATTYPEGTIISWKRDFVTGISNPSQKDTITDVISESLINTTDQPVEVNYIYSLSNTTGCIVADTLKVTVNPTPVINPKNDITYCKGNTVSGIPFSSASPNAAFTWTCFPSIGFGESGSGNIPAFIAGNSIADSVVATVNVSIKASSDQCPGSNSSFTITVLPLLKLSSTRDTSVCDNVLFNYTAKSSARGINFNWKRPVVAGIGNPEESRLNNAAISETLHNTTSQPVVVTYFFTLSSSPLCDASDSVKVTVSPTPKINQLNNETFCNGNSVNGISFASASPNSTITWVSDETVGFGKSGNGNIPVFTATNTGNSPLVANITVSIIASSDQCQGPNSAFSITVYPMLSLSSTKDTSICDNVLFNYIAKSAAKGINFSWKRSVVPGISNPAEIRLNDSLISETLHNTTSQPVVVKYIFTLSAGSLCEIQDSVKVTVNPTPLVNPVNDTAFCNGNIVNGINFSSASPDSSFTWTCDTSIGFGKSGSGSIPVFTATNTGTSPVAANISVFVTASKDNCPGNKDENFKITVNPSPPKPVFSWLNLHNDSVCKGSANISFNINSPVNGISYVWTSNPGSPDISIRDTNDANTVISFPNPDIHSTIKAFAINTANGGCVDSVSQTAKAGSETGIQERKIILQNPGNLLVYPDNTMNPVNGYQWGYDSLVRTIPDRAYGPPKAVDGQVYQFFVPENRFIADNKLDTTRYAYWVILQEGNCFSKVYYNGPYARLKMAEIPPKDNSVGLNVFPDPNNGIFDIVLKGNIYGTVNAKIYNSMAQVVFTVNFVKNSPEVTRNFNTAALTGGLYYLVLSSSDLKKVVARFIIQH